MERNRIKKILSVVVIFMLIFSSLNIIAFAETKEYDADVYNESEMADYDKITDYDEIKNDDGITDSEEYEIWQKMSGGGSPGGGPPIVIIPDDPPELALAIAYGILSPGYPNGAPWVLWDTGLLEIGAGEIDVDWGAFAQSDWHAYADSIIEINITGEIIAGANLVGLFADLPNLTMINGLEYFDTENVTDMTFMFLGAHNLTSLDLSAWNTANVRLMAEMFSQASGLESLDLSGWDTSNVLSMGFMFWEANSLRELTLGNNFQFVSDAWLDTPDIIISTGYWINEISGEIRTSEQLMSNDFTSGTWIWQVRGPNERGPWTVTFNLGGGQMTTPTQQIVEHGDVVVRPMPNPTRSGHSFQFWYTTLPGPLFDFGTPVTNDMTLNARWMQLGIIGPPGPGPMPVLPPFYPYGAPWSFFGGVLEISAGHIDVDWAGWNYYDDRCWYDFAYYITEINITGEIIAGTSLAGLFRDLPNLAVINGLNYIDTSNVQDMSWMFAGAGSLTDLDLSTWDTSNVQDMSWMFAFTNSITDLDLSSWNTSNVTSMNWMFESTGNLTNLNVSTWDTSNVTSMIDMFALTGLTNLDVSRWNTSNVRYMFGMFLGARSLTSLDLSNWDTSNVRLMSSMFLGTNSLRKLALGNETQFQIYAALPTVPNNETYTGYWVHTVSGATRTSEQLMANDFTSGTWRWQVREQIVQQPSPPSGTGGGGGGVRAPELPAVEIPSADVPLASEILHERFIDGFPDGTFRPRDSITRAEAMAILVRALAGSPASDIQSSNTAISFDDVLSDAWYSTYIILEIAHELLRGYPDGTFRPHLGITREEFAAMLARTTTVVSAGSLPFADEASISNWARDYVYTVLREGWMQGDNRMNFNPRSEITRAETVAAVSRMLGRRTIIPESFANISDNATMFSDVHEDAWYFGYIFEATNNSRLQHETGHE